jgi:hypothetical protein
MYWYPTYISDLGSNIRVNNIYLWFFFILLVQLGWQESLNNFRLFYGQIFRNLFKVVIGSSYYCGYIIKKLIYDFFFQIFFKILILTL